MSTCPPCADTSSPGKPTTRFTRSLKVLSTSGGVVNTTMSPRCTECIRYESLLTSTRSLVCSVGYMEPDGIQNVCTTNVRKSTATLTATRMTKPHSTIERTRFPVFFGGEPTGASSVVTISGAAESGAGCCSGSTGEGYKI